MKGNKKMIKRRKSNRNSSKQEMLDISAELLERAGYRKLASKIDKISYYKDQIIE